MKKRTVRKLIKELKPYGILTGLSLFFALGTVAATLYIPILIGDAVDTLPSGSDTLFLMRPILVRMAFVIFLGAISQFVMSLLNQRIVHRFAESLRNRIFRKFERLPLSYLDTHATGDLISRMVSDVDQVSDGLLMGFTQLFTGVLTIIGTLIFMLTVNVPITLAVVAATPVSILITRFIAKKSHTYFEATAKARGAETSFLTEAIVNEKTIKAYQGESDAVNRFTALDETFRMHSLKAVFYSSLVNPSTRFLNAVVYALVGTFGAISVIRSGGVFTIGSLSCFLAYASQYAKPFNEISGVITELQNAFVSADRIFAVLEETEETEPASREEKQKVVGRVEFDHVSFSYVPEKPLIRDFCLNVEPGSHVAIVGRTGCGKTTLINLLMRFYDAREGEIRIDGVPTHTIRRSEVREKFGMVLQETYILAGSIRDNIRLGKPDATDEEIEEAARKTHADSFIRRLPNGYDTILPENGDGLSEGEKQLLSIARVMLKDPPMLILDEATSSIDTRTELKIQDAFLSLMEGRTSFIVAHRLSTIRNADCILVMEDGNIKEQGTHEELLAKQGAYYALYQSQFSGAAV